MQRRSFALLIAAVFALGLAAPPAIAGSYPSSYVRVAGGTASCTMVAASVNDTTNKTGGKTANFKGCSSSNASVNMAAGRLGVEPWGMQDVGVWYYCTDTPNRIVNSVKATSVDRALAIDFGACPRSRGKFFGLANGSRKSDTGTWSARVNAQSPHRTL